MHTRTYSVHMCLFRYVCVSVCMYVHMSIPCNDTTVATCNSLKITKELFPTCLDEVVLIRPFA